MKRIVHIVGSMSPGGMESFIMNIYRNINRNKLQFDFIINYRTEGDFCDEIESLGGRIYIVARKARNPFKNYREVKEVIARNGYEIVIRHSANALAITDLMAAKAAGAKRRIFHAHSSNDGMKLLHYICRRKMDTVATDRFACSEPAGKWMYGKLEFKIINNAIDIKKNRYNAQIRQEEIDKWNMAGCKLYVHVGSYNPVKNHKHIIDVFNCISKKDDNARLMLIGEGPLRKDMEAQIRDYSLENKVILTGIRHDVPRLLQMADLFIFPSVYEGLPLSVIEAQSAGLRCLISDRITDEVIVTDLVSKMDIEDSPENWANRAMELADNYIRRDTYSEVAKAGFDVEVLARFYEEL